MVLGLRTGVRLFIGVLFFFAGGTGPPSYGAVHHVDKVPIAELANPKYHHQCLPIALPGFRHPHRVIEESPAAPRSYQVLVHRATDQGLPQLVMAYHQGFESWVLSAVPSKETQILQAVSRGQRPKSSHPWMMSPEVKSLLDMIQVARSEKAKALQAMQQAEGKLIRHRRYHRRDHAQKTAVLLEAHAEARRQWQERGHQVDQLLQKARDKRVIELFQEFDPAYSVPVEADTVMVWFPGMGTGVSQVLTVKTVVAQTLSLMKGTPREGKIWPVGVSLPKHGGPEHVQTLDDMMTWLDRVVTYYRYMGKKVILAGRSASGTLILEYASRYPEKLAGVLPFGHVWPEREVQINGNQDYMLHGPDEEFRAIAYPKLIDWTIELLTACKWHERMKDPAVRDRLPAIFMAHGWSDDEYKERDVDGVWQSIMPQVVSTFSQWASDIPAIRYLVFEEGWHNLFLVHDANQARGRAYEALRLFLKDPDHFEPQQLAHSVEHFDPLHVHP